MKIARQQIGTVDVFTPGGAIVDHDAEKFNKALLERVRSTNPRVAIAMQEVPYLDSVALEGLVDAADVLADRAARLKLVAVTPTCREILELTGLADKFTFFEDVQDAVRSFL